MKDTAQRLAEWLAEATQHKCPMAAGLVAGWDCCDDMSLDCTDNRAACWHAAADAAAHKTLVKSF